MYLYENECKKKKENTIYIFKLTIKFNLMHNP